MTNETIGVIFSITYVLVAAMGMLPHYTDRINGLPAMPSTGYVRAWDDTVWVRSDEPGWVEVITHQGDKVHLQTNQLYQCPTGTHRVVGGTVIADTDTIRCNSQNRQARHHDSPEQAHDQTTTCFTKVTELTICLEVVP